MKESKTGTENKSTYIQNKTDSSQSVCKHTLNHGRDSTISSFYYKSHCIETTKQYKNDHFSGSLCTLHIFYQGYWNIRKESCYFSQVGVSDILWNLRNFRLNWDISVHLWEANYYTVIYGTKTTLGANKQFDILQSINNRASWKISLHTDLDVIKKCTKSTRNKKKFWTMNSFISSLFYPSVINRK